VHAEFAQKNPDAMKLLVDSSKKVFDDAGFLEAAQKAGEAPESLKFGDQKTCTEYALAMVELANEYASILSAKK
jgi:hypothetical protein